MRNKWGVVNTNPAGSGTKGTKRSVKINEGNKGMDGGKRDVKECNGEVCRRIHLGEIEGMVNGAQEVAPF